MFNIMQRNDYIREKHLYDFQNIKQQEIFKVVPR